MKKAVLFKCMILLCMLPALVYGGGAYEMLPGTYTLDLVISDREESYPVHSSFFVDERGEIVSGSVDYPTYACKAVIHEVEKGHLTHTVMEEMVAGYDSCLEVAYKIRINDKLLFQPRNQEYFLLEGMPESEIVSIRVDEYSYKPTKYSAFRLKNKVANLDDVFESKNSNLIRSYIQVSRNASLKKEIEIKLAQLVQLEEKKYKEIMHSIEIHEFSSYMKKYPGSSYISDATTKLAQIKKNILIEEFRKKATPESFYQAYLLSSDNLDIASLLLEFKNVEQLQQFTSGHEEIKGHRLVINDLVKYYRGMGSLNDFLKAYELSEEEGDLLSILSLSENPIAQMLELYGKNSNYQIKNILLGLYRKKNTRSNYMAAYSLASDRSDLLKVLELTNTMQDLEVFLKSYTDADAVIKAKTKLIKLYRKRGGYEGYYLAYKLLNKTDDLEKAYDKAKTVKQKATMEKLVFDIVKTKGSMVNIDLSLNNPSFSKSNSGGGLLSQSTQYGYMSTYGDLFVSFDKKNLPFQPKYGEYKVSVVLELTIPRSKQVRSKWVGNRDTDANVTETTIVSLYLSPPYNKIKKKFDFIDKAFLYFDRGSTGGFTAIWPSDNPSVKVKKVTVAYNRQSETKNRKLDIDFNKIKNYSRTINHPKAYVSNAYKTGVDWINNFANNSIGQYKNYSSSEYSSSSSSSSNSAHASSNNSANNSSSRQSGVKEYYDGGYKSSKGSKIYIVKCNDGTKVSVHKQVNGSWYSVSSNTGSKYKNLSISAFANKYCS